jgi:predicted phage terminase large subunit-like protein
MVVKPAKQVIRPQPGPQEAFLATSADIAIYGGAAGAGKSWAVLLEPLRHVTKVKDFAAVFFRRNTTQIKNPGGLWDASMKLYPQAGGRPIANVAEWKWKTGGKIKMAHMEHESTKLDWQGSEIPLIVFDELTHFTQSMFFYMLSRNRSTCGVRPYVRATCNPDADSWVAQFIAWWIDQDTGFPIPERAGVIRWFVRLNDTMLWGDSREELVEKYGNPELPPDHADQVHPKSVTFIPGKLTDNPALMKTDPGYLANLKAMPLVEQARLLGGNWKIRPSAGLYYKREWVDLVDALPVNIEVVRYWDLAATEKTDNNDPDWTVGIKLARDRDTGLYYIMHAARMRETPLKVEQALVTTAGNDGLSVRIGLPQDPGQAGKSQAQTFIRKLSLYSVRARPERGDKIVRFGPFSAQCQARNVKMLRGPWNEAVNDALEAFPEATHDDDADACSGAYAMLNEGNVGLLEYYRSEAETKAAAEKAIADAQAIGRVTTPKDFMEALRG